MKRNFVLIVLLLSLFLVVSPNIHAQTTNSACVSKYTEIFNKLNSIQVPDPTFTCTRQGTINDEYWNACAESYYTITAVTQLIGINCENANQQALLNKQLKDTYIKRAKEQLNYYGELPTTNVLTPRPETTPSNDLDVSNLIDNVSPGRIGGACVAGDISLNVLEQPDIVKDSGVSEDKETAQYVKNSKLNILELYRSVNIFIKSFFNATATTEFCPIDDQKDVVPIFYSARDQDNNIDRSSKIDISLKEDKAIQVALNTTQDLESYTKALEAEGFASNKLRIAQAYFLLKSTGNMSIDKKKDTIDQIQTILWDGGINDSVNPSLSCMCVNRGAAALGLQNSPESYIPNTSKTISKENNSNVLGASKPRGEVLGTIAGSCSKLPHLDQPSCVQELTASCANYSDEATCIESIEKSCSFADVRCLINVRRFIRNCKPLLDAKFSSNNEYTKCVDCGLKESGTWTALGCFSSDFSTNVEKIFSIILGFGGLIALGCIIYASFIMQTSAGNPEKTKKAQELITSCIAGLILIIFSVFILRVIGVDILRIPGFRS